MSNSYYTFAEILARLRYNVGRTLLSKNPSITYIRKFPATLNLGSVTVTLSSLGPNYYVYPNWTYTPIHHWTLAEFETVEGTSGARDGQDSGVDGAMDGTLNGTPTITSEDDLTLGSTRYYTTFDGVDDYIDLGDITELDGETQATFGFRIRVTGFDPGRYDVLLARWAADTAERQILINLVPAAATANWNIRVFLATGVGTAAYLITDNTPIEQDTWYSVVVVYDGVQATPQNRVIIYVDGVAKTSYALGQGIWTGTFPASLETATDPVVLGKVLNTGTPSSAYFKGDMYDVVYWSYSLSPTNVLHWHNTEGSGATDRIRASLWKISGTLDTYDIATNRVMLPSRIHKRKRAMVHPRQLTTYL